MPEARLRLWRWRGASRQTARSGGSLKHPKPSRTHAKGGSGIGEERRGACMVTRGSAQELDGCGGGRRRTGSVVGARGIPTIGTVADLGGVPSPPLADLRDAREAALRRAVTGQVDSMEARPMVVLDAVKRQVGLEVAPDLVGVRWDLVRHEVAPGQTCRHVAFSAARLLRGELHLVQGTARLVPPMGRMARRVCRRRCR